MAERAGIVANALVSCDDGHQLRCLAQEFGGCQVNGIERSDRFNWKGARRSRQDGIGY
jgi:hypothetical protein